jgi:hypothetical protein
MQILEKRDTISDTSTGSPFVTDLINEWVRQCDEEHEICRKRRLEYNNRLPTRVISIEHNETNLKLICPPTDSFGDYACLSHCWGSSQHFKTETTSLKDRMASITFSSMPKTFQDAVTISRNLGVKYLWIDSLCIVQDSEEDWNRESANMGQIYRNASITILAASADSDDGGCFVPHNSREKMLCPTPMFDEVISCVTGRAKSPSYVQTRRHHIGLGSMPTEHLLFETVRTIDPRDTPLNRRGWVLQEEILSFRSLSYDPWEVRWRCPGLRACECVPEGFPRESFAHEESGIEASLFREWQEIVRQFSRRKLTFSKDKLPALGGIANEFSRYWQTDYLAGLWRHQLREHLAWFVSVVGPHSGSPNTSRPSEFRAPSWSWASVDGDKLRVQSLPRDSLPHYEHHISRADGLPCEILACWTKPRSVLNPFGEIHSGALVLKGRLAVGKCGPGRTDQWAVDRTTILDVNSGKHIGWFDPDHYSEQPSPDYIWCMPLLDYKGKLQCLALTPFSESATVVNPAGLEQKLDPSSPSVYTRIGTVWGNFDSEKAISSIIPTDGIWHVERPAIEIGHHALLDWVEAAEVRTIIVV